MITIGYSFNSQSFVTSWFPDPREAAFFRDAIRLIHIQTRDEEPTTYEGLCGLFLAHKGTAGVQRYSQMTLDSCPDFQYRSMCQLQGNGHNAR